MADRDYAWSRFDCIVRDYDGGTTRIAGGYRVVAGRYEGQVHEVSGNQHRIHLDEVYCTETEARTAIIKSYDEVFSGIIQR